MGSESRLLDPHRQSIKSTAVFGEADLDFCVMQDGRLAIFWWKCDLIDAVWVALHLMRIMIPVVCAGLLRQGRRQFHREAESTH